MEITTLENFDAVALSSFPYGKSVCLYFKRFPCEVISVKCTYRKDIPDCVGSLYGYTWFFGIIY